MARDEPRMGTDGSFCPVLLFSFFIFPVFTDNSCFLFDGGELSLKDDEEQEENVEESLFRDSNAALYPATFLPNVSPSLSFTSTSKFLALLCKKLSFTFLFMLPSLSTIVVPFSTELFPLVKALSLFAWLFKN